jgi:prepilin-type N-terminal cleavage/methylation domain-containing protein
MTRRKAFTLVELLVVIAIIAVLLAILLPSLTSAKAIAKRLQCAKKLSGIGRAFSMYVEQYDGSLPLVENYNDTPPTIQSTYLLSRNRTVNGVVEGVYRHLGCLYGAGFVDDGKVFFCPAVEGWYGELPSGRNNGTYLGAVHSTTGRFADIRAGVSQPNQGWHANLGYCYWPLSKQYARQTDLDKIGNVSTRSRYNLDLPLSAVKINELMMTRPIVTDNRFHSTKMSGWLIDCLFPDAHVSYQKQPKMDGLNGNGEPGRWGMYSSDENCQFTDDMVRSNMIVDPQERNYSLQRAVTPTQFSYALEQ